MKQTGQNNKNTLHCILHFSGYGWNFYNRKKPPTRRDRPLHISDNKTNLLLLIFYLFKGNYLKEIVHIQHRPCAFEVVVVPGSFMLLGGEVVGVASTQFG